MGTEMKGPVKGNLNLTGEDRELIREFFDVEIEAPEADGSKAEQEDLFGGQKQEPYGWQRRRRNRKQGSSELRQEPGEGEAGNLGGDPVREPKRGPGKDSEADLGGQEPDDRPGDTPIHSNKGEPKIDSEAGEPVVREPSKELLANGDAAATPAKQGSEGEPASWDHEESGSQEADGNSDTGGNLMGTGNPNDGETQEDDWQPDESGDHEYIPIDPDTPACDIRNLHVLFAKIDKAIDGQAKRRQRYEKAADAPPGESDAFPKQIPDNAGHTAEAVEPAAVQDGQEELGNQEKDHDQPTVVPGYGEGIIRTRRKRKKSWASPQGDMEYAGAAKTSEEHGQGSLPGDELNGGEKKSDESVPVHSRSDGEKGSQRTQSVTLADLDPAVCLWPGAEDEPDSEPEDDQDYPLDFDIGAYRKDLDEDSGRKRKRGRDIVNASLADETPYGKKMRQSLGYGSSPYTHTIGGAPDGYGRKREPGYVGRIRRDDKPRAPLGRDRNGAGEKRKIEPIYWAKHPIVIRKCKVCGEKFDAYMGTRVSVCEKCELLEKSDSDTVEDRPITDVLKKRSKEWDIPPELSQSFRKEH